MWKVPRRSPGETDTAYIARLSAQARQYETLQGDSNINVRSRRQFNRRAGVIRAKLAQIGGTDVTRTTSTGPC